MGERIDFTEPLATEVTQEEIIKPKSSDEEKTAIGLETIENVDVAKPLKPKIEKKERVKSHSIEEKSILVGLTEKSDNINSIEDLPENSSQIKPTKITDIKDSVEILSASEMIEIAK